MIRLDRVELLHWDIQPHQDLPLARGVTLITGENGSGKTSVLDAIKIGFGARSPGGDRSVESYLLKQARPVAMIRLVMDNRPAPGTRKRPFDPLGEHAQDVVTLAVVFRAEDEAHYRREYYILDGDVVPIEEGRAKARAGGGTPGTKPLPSRKEYGERLKRVGITPRYLRLLSAPQGQIARLCRQDGAGLFDDLFDIIGGRQALEAWEERIAELRAQKSEHDQTQRDLDHARRDLRLLGEHARRFREFEADQATQGALARALPHVRRRDLDEALARARRLRSSHRAASDRVDADVLREVRRRDEARAQVTEASDARARVEARRDQEHEALRACVSERSGASARLAQVDALRQRAAGVDVVDPGVIEARVASLEVALAEGRASQRARHDEDRQLRTELEEVRRGILPYPEEVRAYQDGLKRAGIPHHVLADVLEVEDEAWWAAIEGYLGRYRFAVLIQDPSDWDAAAALARAQRYPFGVLAPDVRGRSRADEESPLGVVRIREPRYRSLIARLLRPVRLGEPARPFTPPRGPAMLAEDGFVVARLEARVATCPRFYLGRAARERRRREIEARRAELDGMATAWSAEERRLQAARAAEIRALEDQRARLTWEAAREEHEALRIRVAELDEAAAGQRSALEASRQEARAMEARERDARRVVTEAEAGLKHLATEGARAAAQMQDAESEIQRLEEDLGRLRASPLPAPDEAVEALLEARRGLAEIETEQRVLGERLARIPEEARDPMLPVNFERRGQEVRATEERLEALSADLAETRKAADDAREQYHASTRRVFRGYFGSLRRAGADLDYVIEGRLDPREDGRFRADVRIGVGDKAPVSYESEDLSGGQKAALSILMSMTAVSLESDGASFFLIDEPFSASDLVKINELGGFLARTGAQYLVSMPTTADLKECGEWLQAFWLCTRSRGGVGEDGAPRLAPPVKRGYRGGSRDD
jgi:chromosome segregation ATPase